MLPSGSPGVFSSDGPSSAASSFFPRLTMSFNFRIVLILKEVLSLFQCCQVQMLACQVNLVLSTRRCSIQADISVMVDASCT